MSRTYRIRNLPRLTAKKYVDGRAGNNYRRDRERIDKLVEKYYPHIPTEPFGPNWDIRCKVERDFPAPVAWMLDHPLVSWCRCAPIKSWYKKIGNRWGRRRAKSIIKKMSYDETYDSREKFPTRRQEFWDIWSIC